MSPSSPSRPDFVPIESIITFVFIGVVFLVGLIARCLALNHSTIRSAQSLDLMIYQAAPKAAPIPKARRLSTESPLDSHTENRDHKLSIDNPVTPARNQRGPKNL